jgi:EAL domain-containing protein (putative c-di-GMP-specific phosphodiesterase class I)/FixJ family two-component response regulator
MVVSKGGRMRDFSASTALIVEDSTVQREHVAGLLRQIGFGTVLGANDGIDALRTLERRGAPVDLVVTDLDMPGMDGEELIQQLAKRRWAANLIAASANQARLQEAERTLPQEGAMRMLAALSKPLRLETLQALLRDAPMLALAELESDGEVEAASVADVRAALQAGEFIPLYVPRVELESGRLAGIAVQGVWRCEGGRQLDVANVLPALAGASETIGSIVLALAMQAAADLRNWKGLELPAVKLLLPLPDELLLDLGELGRLAASVQAQDIKPGNVCWQISEAVVAACEAEPLHNIGRLSLRGYGIGALHCGRYEAGMRDFACFPLSEITIDPMFVHDAAQRSHRRPLLEGLLSMADTLDIPVCADGIENVQDWTLMRELGCSTGQGAIVGPPLLAAEFAHWYGDNSQRLNGAAPPAAGRG